MQWQDEAIVLSVRAHGETAAICEVFARSQGRCLGMVHGGRSRRLRPVLQSGNHVDAVWKARLADQLGHFSVELRKGYAAAAMEDRAALAGLSSLCALVHLLPERDPAPDLFEIALFVLDFLSDDSVWPALMVRFELALLEELGFRLELDHCAATGARDDLCYVSPKSGCAVSRDAGKAYADRLFRLPAFLAGQGRTSVSRQDLANGFALTGFFLERRVLAPREEQLPQARHRMLKALGLG